MNKHFILATAGHVDHGKSSLVKALTGIDPDRLPEEKARGITIDLGFACLDLPVPGDGGSRFLLGIVDVPGHEDFVKNMVAGVGSVDVALLVVAADDGWMPQTEEHFQILLYLGVRRLVVALTKADLEVTRGVVMDSVREQLCDTPFAETPIIPISTVTGEGIGELRSALAAVLSTIAEPRDIGKPRLAVDRAFTLHGVGTVVTGTLTGGSFSAGQTVVIQPTGEPGRIRAIQSHNQDLGSVGPGRRAALNLADVVVNAQGSTAAGHRGVRRGDTVTLAQCGLPVRTLDVLLTRSPRLAQPRPPAARPLQDGARVRIHHGSGNWLARVLLMNRKELGPGESAVAQLRFEVPIFAFVNDRFIVRDGCEQTTQAGGVVLNAAPAPHSFRHPAGRAFHEACVAAIGDVNARVAAELKHASLVRRADLLVRSGFSATEIAGAAGRLVDEGKARSLGELIADAQWWSALVRRAAEAVEAAHRAAPHLIGLPLAELRAALKEEMVFPEAFEALVADLTQAGFVQAGTAIRRATHRRELPPHLQAGGARVRTALARQPFEPPSRQELASDPGAQQALRFLIETGEVVELGPETVMLKETYSRAAEMVREFLTRQASATVGELRQTLGTTRRIAVPLLERFDRERLTMRQGDQRMLGSAAKTGSVWRERKTDSAAPQERQH